MSESTCTQERDEAREKAERYRRKTLSQDAEIAEAREAFGIATSNCVDAQQRLREIEGVGLKYREAASELIRLLEIEEESDSGSPFKPNRINSCRIMDAMQMNQCLQTLKRLSQ